MPELDPPVNRSHSREADRPDNLEWLRSGGKLLSKPHVGEPRNRADLASYVFMTSADCSGVEQFASKDGSDFTITSSGNIEFQRMQPKK